MDHCNPFMKPNPAAGQWLAYVLVEHFTQPYDWS
jgi:hypothetical protein